jgi:hypothetical protein
MNFRCVVKRSLAGGLVATALLSAWPTAARTYTAARTDPVPLPPRRPPELVAPKVAPRPAPAPSRVEGPPARPGGDDPETCAAVLAGGDVIAEALPAIHSDLCGIEHPLTLKAIVLADRRQIRLEPPVAMRCRLAGAVAAWIVEDVAPIVATAGPPLAALSGVGAYECRGRNGIAGERLSQHAIGNAFDISGLKLADGTMLTVQQQNGAPALFEKIRASACARFSTVLGPGSDSFHQTHLHVDLQERQHGYKMCQWELGAPPVSASQPAPEPAVKSPETAERKN